MFPRRHNSYRRNSDEALRDLEKRAINDIDLRPELAAAQKRSGEPPTYRPCSDCGNYESGAMDLCINDEDIGERCENLICEKSNPNFAKLDSDR